MFSTRTCLGRGLGCVREGDKVFLVRTGHGKGAWSWDGRGIWSQCEWVYLLIFLWTGLGCEQDGADCVTHTDLAGLNEMRWRASCWGPVWQLNKALTNLKVTRKLLWYSHYESHGHQGPINENTENKNKQTYTCKIPNSISNDCKCAAHFILLLSHFILMLFCRNMNKQSKHTFSTSSISFFFF